MKREWQDRVDKFTEADGATSTAAEMYQLTRGFMLHVSRQQQRTTNKQVNLDRLEGLCKKLTDSLDSESPKYSYVGLAFKGDTLSWISHIKSFLSLVVDSLDPKNGHGYRVNTAKGSKLASTFLRTLLSFTNAKAWKILTVPAFAPLSAGMQQLCSNVLGHLVNVGMLKRIKSFLLTGVAGSAGVVLKKTALAAALTLSSRPVVASKYSDKLVSQFLLHILSVPALVKHLQDVCPKEAVEGVLFHSDHNLVWRSIGLLL